MVRPVKGARGFEPSTSTEGVLDVIVHDEGAYALEIARQTGEAHSHVAHNLDYLLEKGHVIAAGDGWQKHYFARFTQWDQDFILATNDDHTWALLAHVAARPSLDNQDEIAAKAGIPPKALRAGANALVDLNVLAKVKIPQPGMGRPGTGFEVRWRDLALPLGLLLVKLPPTGRQAKRLLQLLHLQP